MISFTKPELELMHAGLAGLHVYSDEHAELKGVVLHKLKTEIDDLTELESLDLSDCAGGACKL